MCRLVDAWSIVLGADQLQRLQAKNGTILYFMLNNTSVQKMKNILWNTIGKEN